MAWAHFEWVTFGVVSFDEIRWAKHIVRNIILYEKKMQTITSWQSTTFIETRSSAENNFALNYGHIIENVRICSELISSKCIYDSIQLLRRHASLVSYILIYNFCFAKLFNLLHSVGSPFFSLVKWCNWW